MKKHLSLKKDSRSDTKRKLRSPEERLILKWGQKIPQRSALKRSKVEFDIGLAESDIYTTRHDIFQTNPNLALDTVGSSRLLEDTFHYAMGPTLAFGQCLGLLPIKGILSPDPSNLRFTWKSWLVAYTFLMMSGSVVFSSLNLIRIFLSGINITKFGMFFFYTAVLLSINLFLQLARQWESVIRTISVGETAFVARAAPASAVTLRRKFNIITTIFIAIATFEHSLCIVSGVSSAYACASHRPLGKSYYVKAFPSIFEFFDFSPWKALLIQIWNVQATLLWNFEDLFIILVSLAMADRFEKLNNYLTVSEEMHPFDFYWKSVRLEYVSLSQCVRKMDDAINKIISLTFSANLYLICQQMFNSLSTANEAYNFDTCKNVKERLFWPSIIDAVYFVFSFGFLVVRFLFVSLTAARLHTATKQPKGLLYSVSSQFYCTEIERLLDQVTTDRIGFTGLKLFTITRGLILKIAGTVVTYELVLLQFNTPTADRMANITIFAKDFAANSSLQTRVALHG